MTERRLATEERALRYNRISVDIDGVVAMFAPTILAWVNETYGTNYTLEQYTSSGWLEQTLQKDFGLSVGGASAVWVNHELIKALPPVPGAVRALRGLHLRGAEMIFVTARPPLLRDCTFEWFRQYLPFIKTEQIHMRVDRSLRGVEFKVRTIREWRPDVHIEDSTEIARALAGIPVVLVGWPWNAEINSEMRKENWYEIYRFLVNGRV